MSVEIRRTVRGALPRVPFEKVAHDILGRRYALSIVICGDTLARSINRKYRKKDYAPNVLSFPYSKNEGEIILNARKAWRESRSLSSSYAKHLVFLFIHGCLHLKGLKHGKKMDDLEKKHLRKIGF